MIRTVNVGRDFSPYPGGRVKTHGPYSAEALSELIAPILKAGDSVRLEVDGVICAPSFTHELFVRVAALADDMQIDAAVLMARFTITASDRPIYVAEAERFRAGVLAQTRR